MSARLVPTGVAGLDEVLRGGFRHHNTVLVCGAAGTGKSVLGMHFIRHGILTGEPGVIFTFEQSPDMVYADARSLGWDFEAYERENKLRVIHTNKPTYLTEMREPGNIIEQVLREIGAKRCFVDGFLCGAGPTGAEDAIELRQLFDSLRREGLAVMATRERGSGAAGSFESFLGDTIVQLSFDADRGRRVRRVEVLKSRGQGFLTGMHSFAIVEGDGFVCWPRFKAPSAASLPVRSRERARTGVPTLDAMVSGGFPRGSTTLVAGLPGVGKSLLGMHLLAEGAARGERGLYVTLDEHAEAIEAHAAALGIALPEAIAKGAVSVRRISLLEMEVDRGLHEVREAVHRAGVRRVVIDSISALEAGLDELTFRDYLVALVELLRVEGVTAYLISEIADLASVAAMTTFGTSYLVDNIVLLRYLEFRGQVRRVLTVLKVRGSDHDRTVREFRIGKGGLEVLRGTSSERELLESMPLLDYENLLFGGAGRKASLAPTPVPVPVTLARPAARPAKTKKRIAKKAAPRKRR